MLAGPFAGTFHASGFCCTGRRVRSGLVRQHRELGGVRAQLGAAAQRFAESREIRAEGRAIAAPAGRQTVRFRGVLFGIEPADKPGKDRFLPGRLPGLLPAGTYRFANAPHDTRLAALAFALGSYKFTRYRKAEPNGAQLAIPDGVDGADLSRIAEGVALARDLINTPANDMGPAELEQAARDACRQARRARQERSSATSS